MKLMVLKYCSKIWMTSALLTTFILIPIALPIAPRLAIPLWLLIKAYIRQTVLVLAGSALPWLAIFLLLHSISHLPFAQKVKKLFIWLIAVLPVLTISIIGFLNDSFSNTLGIQGLLIYSISSALSIWFYDLGF